MGFAISAEKILRTYTEKGINMEALKTIQSKLVAPKGQYNSFGNYKYRSCEDILEAVKPLLQETESTLTLSDEVMQLGDRYYVKATATLTNDNKSISVSAYARESETKKGMDSAQITGAASSYARKYALNGLFAIDDTKDSDATNKHDKQSEPKKVSIPEVDNEDGSISESSAKSIMSISKMKGYTQEEVYEIIGKLGYKKVKEILKQDLSTILKSFETDADIWRTWQQ